VTLKQGMDLSEAIWGPEAWDLTNADRPLACRRTDMGSTGNYHPLGVG